MFFPQKLILKIIFLFSCFACSNNSFAQLKKNTLSLEEHTNGIDHFPVYKASQKNSFIDSIIYSGPFITFCVQFEKSTSDGHYLLETINSEHGWTCETATGLSRPVLIKNIRKDGQLISDYLKVTPLDLILKNKENTTTKISCEFQFLRKYFIHGEAKLCESLIKEYNSKKTAFVEFKGIRIRTENYPKPLQKEPIEDFSWARNDLLSQINITVNEVPQKTPTRIITEPSIPQNVLKYTYKVEKSSLNQLFLKKVWHINNATIFRVQYYAPASNYSAVKLYNRRGNKYFIKAGSTKIKMQSIKNIKLNQFLLKEELKDKETLKLEKASSLYLLTYDIYFDRLPDDLQNFDLIEGKNLDSRIMPFSFYSIFLK